MGSVCKAKKMYASRFIRPYYKVEEMGKKSTIILFKGKLVPNSLDGIVISFLFVNGDVAPKPTTLHCMICGICCTLVVVGWLSSKSFRHSHSTCMQGVPIKSTS